MKIVSLYSSSGGNSFLVQEGETTILIDAGKSYRKMFAALAPFGVGARDVDGVFVTHGHCDHTSAIPSLIKNTPFQFHITKPSYTFMYDYMRQLPVSDKLISHDVGYKGKVGQLVVESFPLPHDCPGTVGYIVTNAKGEKYVHATDIGHVTPDLTSAIKGATYLTLESNYDPDMLKCCNRPTIVKHRICADSGHISNSECCGLIDKALEDGTRNFMLAHISAETNTHDLALATACQALAKHDAHDAFLLAADRDKPVVFVG